ncbi:MAG TPA: isochorismatase family protein [Thermohalobaculum sp.]|nr:isochorismatase family protein [Thermohalobaculum sp.]
MVEIDIYARQQFGGSLGFGERPALLIVDFVNGFADPEMFGGGNIRDAISRTEALLAACRARSVPIAFTRIVYASDGSESGAWIRKAPRLAELTEDAAASHIVDELTPLPGELVVRKTQASAFFGTGLVGWLVARRIDTLLVAGATTSGCVRASVVDAISHNLRPIVIEDCVGDRAEAPHLANLFDMRQKYADLITAEAAIAELG